MVSEQSEHNGSGKHRFQRSLPEEFRDSILPQVGGMLSDIESIVRSEKRLLETRLLDRVQRLETSLVFAVMGVGVLFLALGLFVITAIYLAVLTFPSLPIWIAAGGMSVFLALLGGLLLNWRKLSRESKG